MALVFDRDEVYTLNLKHARKQVVVRFPTDAELILREQRIRTLYHTGMPDPELRGLEDANLELARAIWVDGDEVDRDCSRAIVQVVTRAEAGRLRRHGSGRPYLIPIEIVRNITTKHHLREPAEKEIVGRFRERSVWLGDVKDGIKAAKVDMSAAGEFYDSLWVAVQGYATVNRAVPINHKCSAVIALLNHIGVPE